MFTFILLLFSINMYTFLAQANPNELLWEAAKSGLCQEVEKCLGAGADVNSPSRLCYTPLQLAAMNGHANVVRILLQAGAKLDSVVNNMIPICSNITPLHWASMKGYIDIVRLLLEAGADGDVIGAGMTPLSWAVSGEHVAVMRELLDYGVDVNAVEDDGLTPFAHAVAWKKMPVAKLLVFYGADIGKEYGELRALQKKFHSTIKHGLIEENAMPKEVACWMIKAFLGDWQLAAALAR